MHTLSLHDALPILSSLATGGYPQVRAELTRAVVDWKVALMREARAA